MSIAFVLYAVFALVIIHSTIKIVDGIGAYKQQQAKKHDATGKLSNMRNLINVMIPISKSDQDQSSTNNAYIKHK